MLVQKFGGTSLGRKGGLKRVTSIVKSYAEKERVAVVLSAFSSIKKEEGVTSMLLQASQLAVKGKKNFKKILKEIEELHLNLVTTNIKDDKIQNELKKEIRQELLKLQDFLSAIRIIGELTNLSIDNVLCVGERLAAKVFTAVLNSNNIPAVYVDLSGFIKKSFKEADLKLFKFIETRFKAFFKKADNKTIYVFSGFIGRLPGGILAALGRGYTDFTSALLATACKSRELQIWKEVDGIFTANPKTVKNATLLPVIHPEEVAELTYYGSEVIHPATVNYVTKAKIAMRIKNTFNTENEGTLIDINYAPKIEGAIAVTCKQDILVINIHSNKMLMAYGFMDQLFSIFKKYCLVIDLIATSEVNVSLTIENKYLPKQLLVELSEIGKVTVKKQMAIISLVGKGLKNQLGAAGKMFSTLAKENINIEIISQGSSEINISCVILAQDAENALIALHNKMIK